MSVSQKLSRGMKISTGLVLLGIVAGTFLGQWLPDFNGGDGVMPGKSADSKTPAESDKAEDEAPPPEDVPQLNGNVLRITIKGRQYWLETAEDGTAEEISLEQAVAMATAAPGDENGIRVRVTREDDARAKAEDDLKQALLKANLAKESIVGLGDTPSR